MDYSREIFEKTGKSAQVLEELEQYSDMQRVQNMETIINEGLRTALMEETPDQSLEVLLKYLGKALNGERTYIFEKNKFGGDDNTYEWVAEGVNPEKENLQNVPPEVCASWYRNFSIGKNIIIMNLEDIREVEPSQYKILKSQNIRSLVVVPLYDGETCIGFYGVDNPPAKKVEYASNLLWTAAYIIVSFLKQRNLVRKLEERSYNILYALSMDYLGIYQVNFDTDKCEVYQDSRQIGEGEYIHFEDGYQAAMEQYISQHVVSGEQDWLRTVTTKDYVLERLRTEESFLVRYRVKDNFSGLKYMELHFSTIKEAAKKNCVIFAQRDINAVVEKEALNRKELQRRMSKILEGARIGIWTIVLENGCEPRMYPDRTMRHLLGVPKGIEPEECYRRWFENIEPDYVEMVQEAVQEIMEIGHSEVTYPWNHPVLGEIYIRCGGIRGEAPSQSVVSLNGYHQDITETMVARKRQEQSIMELLEKVRQANSVKSEFLAHMSHDLRTPINGILGMLSIMEKSQGDSERQRDCREKIRVSTEHLMSLVNDVLQVSKLESGKPTVVEESFDILDTLGNCISILSAQAEEREIQLIIEETQVPHHRVIGSAMNLKQILINIIDNALKYNCPHGSVFVQVKETGCQRGIANYQFRIKDTGIGIGENFKNHIFEPFTQENPGARTNYDGVGLGMFIVKKLVDQMKGTVEIDSQLDKGSVVLITLPMRIDEAWSTAPVEEEQNEQDTIAGMHVLLVEDNEINCEIVQFMLEEAGAKVVTANDGKVAVETFAASDVGAFDCVLMDLMMPVMDGYEATRTIRSMDRTDAKDVPIIALSANAFEEDVIMAKDAGMNEHLPKPVDVEKMFQTMRRLRR